MRGRQVCVGQVVQRGVGIHPQRVEERPSGVETGFGIAQGDLAPVGGMGVTPDVAGLDQPVRRQTHIRPTRTEDTVNKPTLAATTLAVAAAAGTGSIASPSRDAWWYRQLRKPPYQPPGAAFPLVWTTLYGDIAYTSAAAIDRFRAAGRHDKARRYIAALGVNLLLNAGWSWLFFRYHKLGASALGAVALTTSSADLARRAAEAEPRTGLALLPYPLWCAFATVLSAHIWRLNR
jgi:translocator protein